MTDSVERGGRHGEMAFQPPRYETLEAWERRAAWLREHLLAVQGLWPLPDREPVRATFTGRLEGDGYTVENVYLESWPGFYCTGNLYRPGRGAGPFPGVLHPHGHWSRGRLEDQPLGSIRARCIAMARLGMVSFAYDMVGYNDSLQVPHHRFASFRGALWGISPMALQTWNSIRAVDFLQSLPDVDPQRIGCTGASGGGTQTFLLAAVDERVRVAAPVNMISAHFQGGCVCENVPGLRIDTSNVEIGALMAPRPLLLVSATGDWTTNTPTVEYPAIRAIYDLYGAGDRVAWAQVDAPHNYNAASRAHVYRWFCRWLLGDESPADASSTRGAERPFAAHGDEELRVFPTGQLPAGAATGADLVALLERAARHRLLRMVPTGADELAGLRLVARRRLEHVLGTRAVDPKEVSAEAGEEARSDGWSRLLLTIARAGDGQGVPGTLYTPVEAGGRGALLLHGAGRQGLDDAYGDPGGLVAGLLAAGYSVLGVDVLGVGAARPASPRRDDDWFWATFNPSLLGERVRDVLTAVAYLRGVAPGGVAVVGLSGAGPWALLATAVDDGIAAVCADVGAMRFDVDDAFLGEGFVPALRAYGDLQVTPALVAPRPLLLANTARRFPCTWGEAAYRLLGARDAMLERANPLDDDEILAWLRAAMERDG